MLLSRGFCSLPEPLTSWSPSKEMGNTDHWGAISASASIALGTALTRDKHSWPVPLHAVPDPVCSHSGPCASVFSHLSRLSPYSLLCTPVVTADMRQDLPAPPYADFPFSLCFHALRWTPDVKRESITMWAGWRESRMCQCAPPSVSRAVRATSGA